MTVKNITHISSLKAIEILNRVHIFKGLQPAEKQLIADQPSLFQFVQAGEEFIHFGNYDNSIYVLLTGGAKVIKNGKLIAIIESSDFVGEVAFVTNERRSASVIANVDSILLRVTKDKFQNLPLRMREIIKSHIIEGLLERINKLTTEVMELRKDGSPATELDQQPMQPPSVDSDHPVIDEPEQRKTAHKKDKPAKTSEKKVRRGWIGG